MGKKRKENLSPEKEILTKSRRFAIADRTVHGEAKLPKKRFSDEFPYKNDMICSLEK